MQQKVTQKQGFTIVELLIVVVVIAVLAAITIVAYNGVTGRANASAAQEGVAQAVRKLGLYAIDNGETFPATLAAAGVTAANGTTFQYSVNTSTTPQGYCVTATSNGVSYYQGNNYTYTGGGSTNTLANGTPVAGACPGHATSGTAVNNLALNPNVETNANNYVGPNSSVIVRDTARAYQGAASIKTTMPAASAGTVGLTVYSASVGGVNPLRSNTTYTVSAYVYAPSGTVNPYISIQGSGLVSKTDPTANTTSLKDQWVRIYNSFVTGASGTIVVYILNNGVTTAGMQYGVDNVMLSDGVTTPYNYADGNSAGWAWSGTLNSSTSSGPAL